MLLESWGPGVPQKKRDYSDIRLSRFTSLDTCPSGYQNLKDKHSLLLIPSQYYSPSWNLYMFFFNSFIDD